MTLDRYNFRVIAQLEAKGVILGVHQVWYDADDEPVEYDAVPLALFFPSTEGLHQAFQLAAQALAQPVLAGASLRLRGAEDPIPATEAAPEA